VSVLFVKNETNEKMDKKSPSQMVKDVIERKRVSSRYICGTLTIPANDVATVPISMFIDVPFVVGRIVCENITWAGAFSSTATGITLVNSDLFENQALGVFGDSDATYDSKTADVADGINQSFSNAEVVFGEPKKIRGTYKFPITTVSGAEERGRTGQIAILLKFYEY